MLGKDGGYLGCKVLSCGRRTKVASRFRQVIEPVLEAKAAGFVLAHNHPSGSARPSPADIEATRQLARLSHALDIRFQDHFVIAGPAAFSMRKAGFL